MLFGPWPRDTLAGDLADRQDQEHGASRRTGPYSNPFGSVWQSLLDLGTSSHPVLHWGRVVDYVPMMNTYRVQAEFGSTFVCTLGSLTGHQPTGTRQNTMLPVGCGVFFIGHPQTLYGTILCVDPDYHT